MLTATLESTRLLQLAPGSTGVLQGATLVRGEGGEGAHLDVARSRAHMLCLAPRVSQPQPPVAAGSGRGRGNVSERRVLCQTAHSSLAPLFGARTRSTRCADALESHTSNSGSFRGICESCQ